MMAVLSTVRDGLPFVPWGSSPILNNELSIFSLVPSYPANNLW